MALAGLVTFVTVASVLGQRNDVVEVLVARDPLLSGRAVERSSFDVVVVAADSPLLGNLVSAEASIDASLLGRDLSAGEPLLLSDLLSVSGPGVGRTFTVPVDADVVDGLGLIPGDRLDVLGLVETTDGNGDTIERLDFVAVDLEVTRLPGERAGAFAAASASSWVTVQVSEAQAIALAEAQRLGPVELLRATGAEPLTGGSLAAPGDTTLIDKEAGA